MDTTTTPTPPSGGYSRLSRMLWWFATAIPEIIHDCKSDANRARIIGLGVLFTFIYASIAWIYFWSISVSSPWLYVPLGLFLGFGILTIDRMLIASIKAGKITLVPTIFRVLLALALGTFIAQPVILWMFHDDLQGEIQVLNDAKIEERNQALLTIKASESAALIKEKQALDTALFRKYVDVQAARISYQAEIDGTGGSKRFGIKDVAREKGKILQRLEDEYAQLKTQSQPRLDSINWRLTSLEKKYLEEFATFKENYANAGFLIHVEALQSLMQKDTTGALKERYYLLLIILILFELVPIISKIFLPTGSYDKKMALLDEIEERTFRADFDKDITRHEAYNEATKQQDSRLMNTYFKKSDLAKGEKMDELIDNWKKGNGQSGGLWKKMKAGIFE
jgi:hypothetical protein